MLNKSGSFKIQIEANSKLASSPKDEVIVISNTTNGDLEDLKIYGNTVDGENVGDNKTINITVSQNLVDNGLGELGDNTNFSDLTYNDEKYKSLGSFYRNNDVRYDVRTSNIAINTENEYYMNMCAKDNQTGSRYYFGYVNVDVDKKEGWWENYSSVGLTKLKKDLKNGDDTVYLEDTSSFNGNTKYQNDGLIFWNYTDSRGYTYSPETYSKNVWHSLYEFENINRENNTIKLNTLWNHGTFTKGTKVSQSVGGISNMYPILNNSLLTNEYKCYSAVIDGRSSTYSFNSGVKYIKMLMLNNYYSVQNTETYYSRIVLRKNDNIQNITIDISGHDPLRSIDDTRDYIDYKNKRIVRLIIPDGTKKEREEYEPITLPEIKTYDGNTIIESSDDISPIFQANY